MGLGISFFVVKNEQKYEEVQSHCKAVAQRLAATLEPLHCPHRVTLRREMARSRDFTDGQGEGGLTGFLGPVGCLQIIWCCPSCKTWFQNSEDP